MLDRKIQNHDARIALRGDSVARFNGRPDMHPAVGEFVAAIDAVVDEHLTDDEVKARLERVLRDATMSSLRSRLPQRASARRE